MVLNADLPLARVFSPLHGGFFPLPGGFFPPLPPPPLNRLRSSCRLLLQPSFSPLCGRRPNRKKSFHKHRGGTEKKKPVPAMPHQARTRVASSLWERCFTPKGFFFFFPVPFVAKTILPLTPFKNPSPTLSSFLSFPLFLVSSISPTPPSTPSYLTTSDTP